MGKGLFNIFREGFIRGLGIGAGLTAFAALTILAAQGLTGFSAGEVVSASSLNANFQNLDGKIDAQFNAAVNLAAPPGTVTAFFLSTCPSGWVPADGTNGTPDLRGLFVRGRDDFGTGPAGRDPGGVRAVGHFQGHAFQTHHHGMIGQILRRQAGGSELSVHGGTSTWQYVNTTDTITAGTHTSETRPSNAALLFCMRKGD